MKQVIYWSVVIFICLAPIYFMVSCQKKECEAKGGEFHVGRPGICIKPGSEIK